MECCCLSNISFILNIFYSFSGRLKKRPFFFEYNTYLFYFANWYIILCYQLLNIAYEKVYTFVAFDSVIYIAL